MVTLGILSQDVGVKRKRKFDLVHLKFQKSLIWQASTVDLICLTLSIWELLKFRARHSQWLNGKKSGHSAGDVGLIPVLGRFPGGGSGNPLQCSCLGNPMDRRIWRNTVHGAANSWTQLSNQTTSTTNSLLWGCPVHCRKFSLDASSTYSQLCWSKVSSDFWQMSAGGQNCPWLRTTDVDVHFQLIDSQNAYPRDKLILSFRGSTGLGQIRRQTNTKHTFEKAPTMHQAHSHPLPHWVHKSRWEAFFSPF